LTAVETTYFRQFADLVFSQDKVLQLIEAVEDLLVEPGRIRFRIDILNFEICQARKAQKLKDKGSHLTALKIRKHLQLIVSLSV